MSIRKLFSLPEEELEYLNKTFPFWEAIKERRNWLLIHDFPVPEGYTQKKVIAAIEIPLSYPVARLDMVYFYPALARSDGKAIPKTQSMKTIDGKNFQRWSRHYDNWDPESDSLITHLFTIKEWLLREFRVRR